MELMKFLQPGTKSDTVNTLLEATDYCANIWRHRYDVLYFKTEGSGDTLPSSSSSVSPAPVGHERQSSSSSRVSHRSFQRAITRKYIRSHGPELPVLAIMHVVGEKLPVSINTIMAKFFVDKR